jgi:signal transduction histidine kinase
MKRVLQLVSSMLDEANRARNDDDVLRVMQRGVDNVSALLPADRVALIEFDLTQYRLLRFVSGGTEAEHIMKTIRLDELLEGLTGWVARNHKVALSSKNVPDPRESLSVQSRRRETNAGSIVVAPVRFGSRILGTLTAINNPSGPDFTDADAETVRIFAEVCAIGIVTAETFEAERQSERALEARVDRHSKLFGVLAHDLRGPVGDMVTLLSLLKDELTLDEMYSQLIDSAVDTARKTFELTETLLKWVKKQLEAANPENTACADVAHVVRSAAEGVGALCRQKGVVIEVAEGTPCQTFGDATAIETIVRNALTNAIKFSKPGSGIRVSWQDMKSEVILDIADEGVGMTAEQIEALETPGLSRTTMGTLGERGNGLGLLFSQDLAARLGGRLEWESEPGRGTTVRLHLLPCRQESSNEQSLVQTESGGNLRSPRPPVDQFKTPAESVRALRR